MPRVWQAIVGIGVLWVTNSGCTGQNVEGAWRGPFPLNQADSCRIRLHNTGVFELDCLNREWVGAGRYENGPRSLRFRFALLSHLGVMVRDPDPIRVDFIGQGNRLVLSDGREWTRMYP